MNEGTRSDPFDSFENIPSLSKGDTVFLERGSRFRSQLLDGSSIDGLEITSYGEGNIPFVQCDDEIFDDEWSPTNEQTNTYQVSYTARDKSSQLNVYSIRVWEDGAELVQRESISNVESNPGSYYADDSDDPWVIYIHPTGSTDPTSDNRTYEWTSRGWAVANRKGPNRADGAVISDIHARRNLSNNGAITMGAGGSIKRTLVEDGAKHHYLHGGDGIFRDSIMYGSSPNWGKNYSIGLVYFNPSGTPGEPWDVKVRKVGLVDATHTRGISTRPHGTFNPEDIESLWSVGKNNGALFKIREGEVRGVYMGRGNILGSVGKNGTVKYASVNSLGRLEASQGRREFTYENSVIVHSMIKRQATTNGQVVTLKNCVLVMGRGSGKGIIRDTKGNDLTVRLKKCVVISLIGPPVNDRDGISVTGDHCIFFSGRKGSEVRVNNDEESLSRLQSRSGMFKNSVWLSDSQYRNFWLGDWRKGDFRVNANANVTDAAGTIHSGQLPDGTDLAEVGQQKHWDWANEHPVSGPQEQWPTPPSTRQESIAFVNDPDSWDWKGTPPDNRETFQLQDRDLSYWAMDGVSGDPEPDVGDGNDLHIVKNTVDAGSTAEYSYRDFSNGSLKRTDGAGFSGVLNTGTTPWWMAFPLRIGAFDDNAIWGFDRGFRGIQMRALSTGRIEFSRSSKPNDFEVTVDAEAGTFKVCQCWYNPGDGIVGVRYGSSEVTSKASIGSAIGIVGSTDFMLGASGNAGPGDVDIGPMMIAEAAPSQGDRDWIDNDGGFRSLSVIQSREITQKTV